MAHAQWGVLQQGLTSNRNTKHSRTLHVLFFRPTSLIPHPHFPTAPYHTHSKFPPALYHIHIYIHISIQPYTTSTFPSNPIPHPYVFPLASTVLLPSYHAYYICIRCPLYSMTSLSLVPASTHTSGLPPQSTSTTSITQ